MIPPLKYFQSRVADSLFQSLYDFLYSLLIIIHCSPACLRLCNAILLQFAICPCQTGPPQQLMSLKTLRWVVALITNHGCLPPAAALTAAVPIIDGILQDSPRPNSADSKCIFFPVARARMIQFRIGKHFAQLSLLSVQMKQVVASNLFFCKYMFTK